MNCDPTYRYEFIMQYAWKRICDLHPQRVQGILRRQSTIIFVETRVQKTTIPNGKLKKVSYFSMKKKEQSRFGLPKYSTEYFEPVIELGYLKHQNSPVTAPFGWLHRYSKISISFLCSSIFIKYGT